MRLSESELEERSKRYGLEMHFIAGCPICDCFKPGREFVYVGSFENNGEVLKVGGYDLHLYNCENGCESAIALQSIREYNHDSLLGSIQSSQ